MKRHSLSCTAVVVTLTTCLLLASCRTKPDEAVTLPSSHVLVTHPPRVNKRLYPPPEEAKADFANALAQARRDHKRVLVDFGSNSCGDCQVLDMYFHRPPNDGLLNSFVKVNINVGHIDTNLDIARRCKTQLDGIPGLAVLDSNGDVLASQGHDFSNMRSMQPETVTDFLERWKS